MGAMGQATTFAVACEERGWGQPAVFRAAYAVVAGRLGEPGEPGEVTARQFHRWRQPDPPCPRPSKQRVLEEMFGMPLEQLGFCLPVHRRSDQALEAQVSLGGSGVSVTSPAPLRFTVLGPVRIWRGPDALRVGGPQERAMLCVLLLQESRVVSAAELIDALWGETPPDRALATVRTYASRLRRTVGSDVLVSEAGGYLLRVAPGELDLTVCERYQAQAQQARAEGDLSAAREALDKAVVLWEGEPLAGVAGPYAHAQRERLAQFKLGLLELRSEISLEAGLHNDVISDLTALAAQYPLRERLRALLMLALYRSGRQAEAFDVYADIRRLLADELGVDPGPELAELHQRILQADPTLTAPARPVTVPGRAAVPVPRQLPAPPAIFTGRSRELARLDDALGRDGDHGATLVISAIGGTGGIGKTWLALHWAHQRVKDFPDGQLYVNLRGFDPAQSPMPPGAALHTFLEALGASPRSIPADLDAQSALYRSLVAERRMLIVLDNARNSEQVIPLLPGGTSCTVLVTSRQQLPSLITAHCARPITVDTLDDAEGYRLLADHLSPARVATEPEAVADLLERCGGLPLALGVVAARAALRPDFPLAHLAAELRADPNRLDAFDTGEITASVRAVFSWSYHALTPPAARLFRRLGHYPGPDISTTAMAALAGTTTEQLRPPLAELARAHLIDEYIPGRYTLHDLLRAYAAELAEAIDTKDERHDAVRRILDHYLHSAANAQAYVTRSPHSIALPPHAPGVAPVKPADQGAAIVWLSSELPVLDAAMELATDTDFVTHAWQLAGTLTTFLDMQGHWHSAVATHERVLHAAQRAGDTAGQAWMHAGLAWALGRLGRHGNARHHLDRALALFTELGDRTGQARMHQHAAWLLGFQQGCSESLTHSRQAHALYEADGNLSGMAHALNSISVDLCLLDRCQEAVAPCEQALHMFEQLGSPHGQAATWDSLGYIHHHLKEHDRALACYSNALELHQHLGDRYRQGEILTRSGETHLAAGDPEAARTAWQRALKIFLELDHPDAEAVQARLRDVRTDGYGAPL